MTSPTSLELDLRDGDLSGVVVVELRSEVGIDMSTWSEGPLPIVQPQNRTTQRLGHESVTNAQTRGTLVAPDQAEVLYGQTDFTRAHLLSARDRGLLAAELFVELVPRGGFEPVAFLALHVAMPAAGSAGTNQLSWWADLVRAERKSNSLWRAASESTGIEPDQLGKSRHLVISTADKSEAMRKAYALVSGAAADQLSDVADRAERHEPTLRKPDWTALALRDGAAFVAHQTSSEPYGPTLRMLMHSVYTDALLLAWTQRRLLDRSGSRAARVDLASPDELVRLEQDHYDFKRRYWRTSLSHKRTAPLDEIYQAFQTQLLTLLDVTDVEDRVRNGARLSLSLFAKSQEEFARSQEDAARALQKEKERLTLLVQQATAGIGAFGLCYTAAPVITTPSWSHFAIATAVAIPLAIVIFTVLYMLHSRHQDSTSSGSTQ